MSDYEEDDEEEFVMGSFDDSPFCPKFNSSMANVVVVQNTPKVPRAKEEKLKGVIVRLLQKIGTAKTIEMPFGADDMSLGFCFLEMENPKQADKVIEALDEYKLDKSHVFSVISWETFEKFLNIPDEYSPPEAKAREDTECLISWLMDEQARDQFVITHGQQSVGTTTGVFWNELREKPKEIVSRKKWTENFVIWSPRGTYLLTMHGPGMALWGGESFKKVAKFAHRGCTLVDFSPCERYLVSWSNTARAGEENMIVWDVKQGRKIRGFAINQENVQWPMLQWASDDSLCAREMEDGTIACFELPSMQPACKRIKSGGCAGLCFSPTKPWLSYWIPEHDNNPARVIIQEIPSREEVKAKVLFNVAKCSFFWQSSGEYLAVQVDRVSKTGKTTYTNFELFRCCDKEIPVQVLEFKDSIHGFAWEPKGNRFCVLHGEPPRVDVSFYTMGSRHDKTPVCALLHKLEKKAVNEIRWSPRGTNLILAGLRNLNGQLEWWSCTDRELQQTGTDEHFMCTDIEWDPTGRYVATSVQALRTTMENGYAVWTLQGRMLNKTPIEHFQKLQWRTRPPSLLSDKDEKSLMKNLRKYREEFDRIDNEIAAQQLSEENEGRRVLRDEFDELIKKWAKMHARQAGERAEMRGYASDDEEYVMVEETYEDVLEVEEEYLKDA
jgi:translation initiation factor 3 subunit B